MSWARNSENSLLAATSSLPAARVGDVAALAAWTTQTKRALVSEVALLSTVSVGAEPVARVSEIAALVAYTTGTPEVVRHRAWTFDFDGHQFYVLDLGAEGTYVFDLTTGAWCEFETQGYDAWNMRSGIKWNHRYVALDAVNPIVWEVDPASQTDEEWKEIEHALTAMIQFRHRKARRNDALRVTASVGQLGAADATLRMRFSDDRGQTWSDYYEITMEDDAFTQELAFRSLGSIKAPGRVFELSDTSGTIRVDGADAEVEGTAEEFQDQMGGRSGD